MPKKIIAFIDLFYPPFKKWMPEQTFRYAVCGGANTVLGLLVFSVFLKLIFREHFINLWFYTFEAYSVALGISFCINFMVGFILMKRVVFVDSNLRGRIQLFRYFLSFGFNLVLFTSFPGSGFTLGCPMVADHHYLYHCNSQLPKSETF
jgi:putative flippase GtrA